MKIYWIVCISSLVCASERQQIIRRDLPAVAAQSLSYFRGVVNSSIEGDLICSVMHNADEETYSGVLLNNKFEPTFWFMKRIDEGLSRQYYYQLKEKAERKR